MSLFTVNVNVGYDDDTLDNPALEQIALLALDVDGVLTDGTIQMGAQGELFKSFYAQDGLGISVALRSGLYIAIITGRKSEIIHRRAQELGIQLVQEGVKDKYLALEQLQNQLGLRRGQVAYMGDDLNDLPAFRAAGVTFAPADAVKEVREAASFVTEARGGRGAVREAIEMILQAQHKWEQIVNAYLNAGQGDKQ